jgi:hypothetical protein
MLTALLLATPATAKTPQRTSPKLRLATKTTVKKLSGGVLRYHFVYGPLHISPGQNSIFIEPNTKQGKTRPPQDGYILNFRPNLIMDDGTIPRVDVVHLHHAVWLVNGRPWWAAGEEKTQAKLPRGYAWPYKASDLWNMNHMIHDLTPSPYKVYITFDMDFLPADAPAAKNIRAVSTQWMDVAGGLYPVFDAIKGQGKKQGGKQRFTFPDDDPNAYPVRRKRNQWTVNRNVTLVQTAGHLHPGGLYTDLKVTRDAKTINLFRSRAKYYEPAGAVSWDVSLTTTPPDWKINLKPGDVVSVSGTYDTSKASWYESMAIMPVAVAEGWQGVDPFTEKFNRRGVLTHGPLAENRNHGGVASGLPNPVNFLDGPISDGKIVTIENFIYEQGNFPAPSRQQRPPTIHQGQSLTFMNLDARPGQTGQLFAANDGNLPIYHTITACKQPCNKSTGIAYPLADGRVSFDSGELGYGPPNGTAAAQRDTWQTPENLDPGTYTYFCRIHPFMRGSFRVISP